MQWWFWLGVGLLFGTTLGVFIAGLLFASKCAECQATAMEDAMDVVAADEARNDREPTMSFDEYMTKRAKDGGNG
jgi:hypothetical protein